MKGLMEKTFRSHNTWCCVCHGALAGFKLAIGSAAEAAAYLGIMVIHGLCARADILGKPPHQG
jgi:hypothetical protein